MKRKSKIIFISLAAIVLFVIAMSAFCNFYLKYAERDYFVHNYKTCLEVEYLASVAKANKNETLVDAKRQRSYSEEGCKLEERTALYLGVDQEEIDSMKEAAYQKLITEYKDRLSPNSF